MAPDEPTRAPVMIRAELPSVKPMPAAAQPEYELSIEITTGMSAPPIGMMMSTPNAKAAKTSSQKAIWLSARAKKAMSATMARARAMLMAWRAGRMMAAPLMRPDNFRNAITEPVNVTAPIATPSDISMRLDVWIAPTVPMSNAAGA